MAKSVTLSAVNSSLDQAATRPWTGAVMRCASAKNPVDLVHLSRQSLGDRSLENEILQLFLSQSQLYLSRLECATTADERKFAAHTVVGSARGLGAWRVAAEAEIVEKSCIRGCDVSALRNAVQEANSYIESLLGDIDPQSGAPI
jgi:HPt (histidine-containing phosphotransfer) domain-containing protein